MSDTFYIYLAIIGAIALLIIAFFPSKKSNTKSTALAKPSLHKRKRERLKLMYKFFTDKAEYYGYNTQTIETDCVNIEIEEVRNGKRRIILQEEIFDNSWGAMGGTAFGGLVQDSKHHLRNYIKANNELLIREEDYILKEMTTSHGDIIKIHD